MVTASHHRLDQSSVFIPVSSELSATDNSSCITTKEALLSPPSAVNLSEDCVNNSNSEKIPQTNSTTSYTESSYFTQPSQPYCCKCVQLTNKLKSAHDEIKSLNKIIELLNKDEKSTIQVQQDNLTQEVRPGNTGVSILMSLSSVKHQNQIVQCEDIFTIPTANRYAVLSLVPDDTTPNSTLFLGSETT